MSSADKPLRNGQMRKKKKVMANSNARHLGECSGTSERGVLLGHNVIRTNELRTEQPLHPSPDTREVHGPPSANVKYRGVTRMSNGRYQVCCTVGKNSRKTFGTYASEDEAAKIYDRVALRFLGQAAHTNFPLETYQKDLEEMKGMAPEQYVDQLIKKPSNSKYQGVTRAYHTDGQPVWRARIKTRENAEGMMKEKRLGSFGTEEAAAEAYDRAAISIHGPKARTNFDRTRYETTSTPTPPFNNTIEADNNGPVVHISDSSSMEGDLVSNSHALVNQPVDACQDTLLNRALTEQGDAHVRNLEKTVEQNATRVKSLEREVASERKRFEEEEARRKFAEDEVERLQKELEKFR